MEEKISTLKWAFGAGIAAVIAFFTLPVLASMAINLVTIAMSGVVLMGLWILLPAISELLAQLGYRLWEMAIRGDPIAKLKRELKAHSDQISNTEKRISESSAQVTQLENLLREERRTLSQEDIDQWVAQISMLKQACAELISLRDQSVKEHQDFERDVSKAEAQYKIGKAFKSAMGSFTFNQKAGRDGEGAKVAINEVQKQLAESQAKLSVVLSRKSNAVPLYQPAALINPQ